MMQEGIEERSDSGIEFLVGWVEEINDELQKRERVSNKPRRYGSYPQVDRFKRLREEVPLLRYCSEFGPILRRRGRSWVGLCPFPDHHEKTPSFTVDPEKDTFHCFGCNRHGDIFHLGMFAFQVDSNYECLLALEKHFGVSQVVLQFPARPGSNQGLTRDDDYRIQVY